MKCRKIIPIVMILSCGLAGCGQTEEKPDIVWADDTQEADGVTENLENAEPQDLAAAVRQEYTVQADLTHDGEKETIVVDVTEILSDSQAPAYVTVSDSDGQTIWQQELFLPHAGWGAYYLVEPEGEAYLLYYLPELSQGLGIYSYRLFSLDGQGTEWEEASGEITFDAYPYAEEINFPMEKMEAFAQEVNQYLQNGFLLVSTVDGDLRYSTAENRIKDEERYTELAEEAAELVELTETDSIQDNLEAFWKYLNELKARI